ncbi:hypothetical protein OPT61_g10106 [Boeremia exigua]|uniref:Uncharacterized protein n=1 Tax=Boeremia exigua TaxID=749465 RepID=A0ACC2HR67_9PLEO|nr:hypothetical protein OPT61_g10106 [Boeremia exigua]
MVRYCLVFSPHRIVGRKPEIPTFNTASPSTPPLPHTPAPLRTQTMPTNTPTAAPKPSPTHPLEAPQMTLEEVVHYLADRNKPPLPMCYEDYPEWKRWALGGGLEEFAKSHNVHVSFILYEMPKELYEAQAGSDAIMAIIEGWDEESSGSEEEPLCLPKVEVKASEASEVVGPGLQADCGAAFRGDARGLSSPCRDTEAET